MSVASEQKFYDYIHLEYEDDDGQPLDEDLGEVLWGQGRGSTEEGDVTYIRIDRVAELVRELRQYVINHEIAIGECVAWQELKAMVKDAQGVLIFGSK